jgi:hypothetical protein
VGEGDIDTPWCRLKEGKRCSQVSLPVTDMTFIWDVAFFSLNLWKPHDALVALLCRHNRASMLPLQSRGSRHTPCMLAETTRSVVCLVIGIHGKCSLRQTDLCGSHHRRSCQPCHPASRCCRSDECQPGASHLRPPHFHNKHARMWMAN